MFYRNNLLRVVTLIGATLCLLAISLLGKSPMTTASIIARGVPGPVVLPRLHSSSALVPELLSDDVWQARVISNDQTVDRTLTWSFGRGYLTEWTQDNINLTRTEDWSTTYSIVEDGYSVTSTQAGNPMHLSIVTPEGSSTPVLIARANPDLGISVDSQLPFNRAGFPPIYYCWSATNSCGPDGTCCDCCWDLHRCLSFPTWTDQYCCSRTCNFIQ